MRLSADVLCAMLALLVLVYTARQALLSCSFSQRRLMGVILVTSLLMLCGLCGVQMSDVMDFRLVFVADLAAQSVAFGFLVATFLLFLVIPREKPAFARFAQKLLSVHAKL